VKTYKCTVLRVEYQEAVVFVDAESVDEARDLADQCDSAEFAVANAEQTVTVAPTAPLRI